MKQNAEKLMMDEMTPRLEIVPRLTPPETVVLPSPCHTRKARQEVAVLSWKMRTMRLRIRTVSA